MFCILILVTIKWTTMCTLPGASRSRQSLQGSDFCCDCDQCCSYLCWGCSSLVSLPLRARHQVLSKAGQGITAARCDPQHKPHYFNNKWPRLAVRCFSRVCVRLPDPPRAHLGRGLGAAFWEGPSQGQFDKRQHREGDEIRREGWGREATRMEGLDQGDGSQCGRGPDMKAGWAQKLGQLVHGATHSWISDFVASVKLQPFQHGMIVSFRHGSVPSDYTLVLKKKKLLSIFQFQYSCSWQNLKLSATPLPMFTPVFIG